MEYSNISTMLSQLTGQSVYAGKNVSQTAGKQAVEILLKNLEPGQIFSGEITDIRGSYVTITLQNMQSVQAKMAENFEFLIGQKALFQVKDNQNSQLFIRPVDIDGMQNGELMVAERALTAASLKVTEKTLELVKNLMNEGQPIDKQNILSYMRQLAKYPEAEISDLVMLRKNDLPVNGETVSQMANYRQFEHSILKDAAEIKQKLPDIITELAKESPERAQQLLKGVTAALMPETEESQSAAGSESPSTAVSEQLNAEKLTEKIREEKEPTTAARTASEQQNEKAELPQEPDGKAPVKQEKGALGKLLVVCKDPALFTSKESGQRVKELLREALEEALLLKPEDTADKEKVKQYYKDVRDKSEALKDLFQNFGRETASLQKPTQNMVQNLQFMQSLNEVFTYIQLPLKMTNQEAHGDLYVYTKKKAKGNTQEGLSAFLHLDMEHLGSVDVLVKLNGQRVGTNFTLETEELLDFIEEHMELLTDRLQKKGYDCSTQVVLKNPEEPEQSFEQRLTGETAATGDIRRFSFDVRA